MRALAIAASVVAAGLASCTRHVERPNVLLITIDTLRADRLSSSGYPRATTPSLDRLAAEGLRFTHAETPRAKTTPAIASLMTGLYPHDHGARDLLMPLDGRLPLLSERLRDAGWRTGAIVGNYVLLDRHSGLARGFDRWTEDLPDTEGVPPDDVPERRARSMTDAALSALGLAKTPNPESSLAPGGDPWFLWLHYMDPHGLYDPPDEHRVFESETPDPIPDPPEILSGDIQRFTVAEYNVPPDCRMGDGRVDAARVRDLYDGEVRFVDAEIGRLMDALRASGTLERTLVVVTADHGESLGEHRYWFEHGRDAYETTCRVPLLVRFPTILGDRPKPGIRRGDLSLVDVAPTILDLLGLPPLMPGEDTTIRGRSREELFVEDSHAPHPVFVEKVDRAERSGSVQSKAVRIGDWKLIRRYTQVFEPESAGEKRLVVLSDELYDLARDPGETMNLVADPPASAPLLRLQAALLRFAADDVRFADLAQLLQRRREELGREDREALRVIQALGY